MMKHLCLNSVLSIYLWFYEIEKNYYFVYHLSFSQELALLEIVQIRSVVQTQNL